MAGTHRQSGVVHQQSRANTPGHAGGDSVDDVLGADLAQVGHHEFQAIGRIRLDRDAARRGFLLEGRFKPPAVVIQGRTPGLRCVGLLGALLLEAF